VSRAYIGLGSNEGDRLDNLKAGVADLSAADDVVVVGKSGVYDSEPVGMTDQGDFLNAVVAVETTLDPYRLLSLLHKIELEHGRQRITRWGPRALDLDILLFGDLEQDDPKLTTPHPRLRERRFVMEPLLEVDPEVRLPDGTPVQNLLEGFGDSQVVWRSGEL
jgi:2-amino-4-hydroxy-6-hydroxymethyldihydropteridine diphosphokinase